MPFGLNIAPFIFTKLLKLAIKRLRERGHILVIYLDDDCKTTKNTIELLYSLGFILNLEKSILIPTQNITFLGFTFNSVLMTLGLPIEKAEDIKNKLTRLRQKQIAE